MWLNSINELWLIKISKDDNDDCTMWERFSVWHCQPAVIGRFRSFDSPSTIRQDEFEYHLIKISLHAVRRSYSNRKRERQFSELEMHNISMGMRRSKRRDKNSKKSRIFFVFFWACTNNNRCERGATTAREKTRSIKLLFHGYKNHHWNYICR